MRWHHGLAALTSLYRLAKYSNVVGSAPDLTLNAARKNINSIISIFTTKQKLSKVCKTLITLAFVYQMTNTPSVAQHQAFMYEIKKVIVQLLLACRYLHTKFTWMIKQ